MSGPNSRGGWRVGIMPAVDGVPAATIAASLGVPKRDGVVKTQREKAEGKAPSDVVREQIQNGTLVIRKMTDEERRRYPPRTKQPKRPRRRD